MFVPQLLSTAHSRYALGRHTITLCLLLSAPALSAAPALPAQPNAGSPAAPPSDPANDGTAQTLALTLPLTPLPGRGSGRIAVRLNEKVDAMFLVDTGTSFVALSESLAKKLGLKPHPAVGLDGKPGLIHGKQGSAVTITSLQFPGAAGSGQMPGLAGDILVLPDQALAFPPAPAHASETSTLLDGIVGASLLKHFAVAFNFAGHTLTLFYPGGFSARQARLVGCFGPGGTSLPLTPPPDQPDADRFFVPVRLTSGDVSRDVSLAVDTGSDTTDIPRSLAQDLHLKTTGQQRQYGMEGDFPADEARVPTFALGDLRLANARVLYPDKGDVYPWLGMDILSGYRVLLDFPGKKMYLQPASMIAPAKESASPAGKKTQTP